MSDPRCGLFFLALRFFSVVELALRLLPHHVHSASIKLEAAIEFAGCFTKFSLNFTFVADFTFALELCKAVASFAKFPRLYIFS